MELGPVKTDRKFEVFSKVLVNSPTSCSDPRRSRLYPGPRHPHSGRCLQIVSRTWLHPPEKRDEDEGFENGNLERRIPWVTR